MRFILFVLFLFPVLVCSQQIWSLEQYGNAISSESDIPDSVTYFKDVNNSLDQFIGTWIGTQNGKTVTFVINETTEEIYEGINIDRLLVRYKIQDISGNVLINTINHSDDSIYIAKGSYLMDTTYYMRYYFGHNIANNNIDLNCGSYGTLILRREVLQNGDISIKLVFNMNTEMYTDNECPNGIATIPLQLRNVFELIKQ